MSSWHERPLQGLSGRRHFWPEAVVVADRLYSIKVIKVYPRIGIGVKGPALPPRKSSGSWAAMFLRSLHKAARRLELRFFCLLLPAHAHGGLRASIANRACALSGLIRIWPVRELQSMGTFGGSIGPRGRQA